jgi:chemotaxis protein CheD
MRYGSYALEVLINDLLKAGARRERLEAKVFGGGAVLANMTTLNIGDRNAEFVLRYLKTEEIRVAAQDLRGPHARRVSYFPQTGLALVRRLTRQDDQVVVERNERALARAISATSPRSGVELFGRRATTPAGS